MKLPELTFSYSEIPGKAGEPRYGYAVEYYLGDVRLTRLVLTDEGERGHALAVITRIRECRPVLPGETSLAHFRRAREIWYDRKENHEKKV